MQPEIRKILYTTDLSQNAAHAFGYAATLANRFDAQITILHVIEDLSSLSSVQIAQMLGEEKWKAIQDENIHKVRDTIAERLSVFCERMTEELKACPFLVADILVQRGVPVERILRQAEKLGADLIVMGTRGQGLVADAVLGSTARRVVRRSKRPVLTIRLPE